MPTLSDLSLRRLKSCHADLQRVVLRSAEKTGLAVIYGHRDQADQEHACETGKSRLHWPHSRHNSDPSQAVDLAPWPLDWTDIPAFKALAAVVKESAAELGVPITWGGDWKTFPDLDHFELTKT